MAGEGVGGRKQGRVQAPTPSLPLVYLSSGERDVGAQACAKGRRAGPVITCSCYETTTFARGTTRPPATRYAKAFPHLSQRSCRRFSLRDLVAIELALVLQHTGEGERAKALLDHSEAYLRTIPRMGLSGYGIADVAIHALRGDTTTALAKLREAERAGWRVSWRYLRDFDPNLASIRNEPEFKAVFADIERDMARQRAELAKRPKDAPLDLAAGD